MSKEKDILDFKNFVYIPFLEYWEKKMLNGEKIATTRVRQYGKIGSYFKIFNTVFQITDIKKIALRIVRDKYYMKEGCDTSEKFESIWTNIHYKKGFDPEQLVFLHVFTKVS
jgi:hypothetical protein